MGWPIEEPGKGKIGEVGKRGQTKKGRWGQRKILREHLVSRRAPFGAIITRATGDTQPTKPSLPET